MIQRKQSLFLLAVAIISGISLFIPFQNFKTDNKEWPICLLPGCSAEVVSSSIYAPMILSFVSILLAFITIFLFKNRVLQYKLANLLALINIFVTGIFFLLSFTKPELQGESHFLFGAFIPVINALIAFLAAHFIKKDELLVRNANRIR